MIVPVRAKVSFVTYVAGEPINCQTGQLVRLPKRLAEQLVKADMAVYEFSPAAPENKSEGPSPEVKVARKRTTAKRAQAKPKPE